PPVYGLVMDPSPCPPASSFWDKKYAGREARSCSRDGGATKMTSPGRPAISTTAAGESAYQGVRLRGQGTAIRERASHARPQGKPIGRHELERRVAHEPFARSRRFESLASSPGDQLRMKPTMPLVLARIGSAMACARFAPSARIRSISTGCAS